MAREATRRIAAVVLATVAVVVFIVVFFAFEVVGTHAPESVMCLAATEIVVFAIAVGLSWVYPVDYPLVCAGFVVALVVYLFALCAPLAPFTANLVAQPILLQVSMGAMAACGLLLLGDIILSFHIDRAGPMVVFGLVVAIAIVLFAQGLPTEISQFVRGSLFPLFLLVAMVFLTQRKRLEPECVPASSAVSSQVSGWREVVSSLLQVQQGTWVFPYAAVLLIMFAFGVFEALPRDEEQLTGVLSWGIALAVSLVLLFAITRKNGLSWCYAVFLIMFVLCVATMPLAAGFFHVPYALLLSLFVFSQVLVWLLLVEIFKTCNYPPAFLFGLFTIPPVLAYAAGIAFVSAPGIAQALDANSFPVVVMVVLASICIAAVGALVVVVRRGMVQPMSAESSKSVSPVSVAVPESGQTGLSLQEALDVLCARYGLSDRDREIVSLYAQGRDAPFISSELHISRSTVKTHVRNVYNKMGIHSKQELIDCLHNMR